MRTGIEKEAILGMLTDMVYNLEEADTNLHVSMEGIRTNMYSAHSVSMEGFRVVLESLENDLSVYDYSSSPLITDTKGLKLELGF
jgi:hypothetical protein